MRNMTAILWCNGKKPSNELIKRVLTEEKEVFGVDGGADVALSAGINVKKVLGDFDSVNINDWKGKGKYLSNQNISDFGKSIKYLVKKEYSEIEVLGIDGGSPEHLLGIWAVLAEIEDNVKITLHHERRTTYRIHPTYGETKIFVGAGKEFSIFALTPCNNFSLSGAKWNIKNEIFSLSSRGLHNQGTGKKILIKTDGIVVLII
jgi:thiamine pyrophosphokinase